MATSNNVFSVTLPAGADLSSSQFLAVVPNGDGEAILPGAGDKALGFLQNKPVENAAAQVQVLGLTKAVSGAAVTAGAEVEVTAAGKVINLATGISVGFAKIGSVGADETISVWLV